jgi:hypothetical protein
MTLLTSEELRFLKWISNGEQKYIRDDSLISTRKLINEKYVVVSTIEGISPAGFHFAVVKITWKGLWTSFLANKGCYG